MNRDDDNDCLEVDSEVAHRLLAGMHAAPHDVLGCHPTTLAGEPACFIRAMHPDAKSVVAEVSGHSVELRPLAQAGLFGAVFSASESRILPRLSFLFQDGQQWTLGDPYSHWPTLGDDDLHLFNEGCHFEVWRVLGARARNHEGVFGTAFAVWAPTAVAVSLVGDFNNWDRRLLPMRAMGSSGIFELFVPCVVEGARYQFDVYTRSSEVLRKTDPYAEATDHPPGRAGVVTAASRYPWGDAGYLRQRRERDVRHGAMNIYEVHPGSFARHSDGRVLGYRELADALIPHMEHFGFTHLELLPIAEHPFDGSWGYQVTGFYAPSSRFGSPDDFRYLVDRCHQHGIGVIIDWVPAHFPKDDFALARFDGTPLYEHADPRQGEHPDWGTLIFNYGRNEVANFLIGSALYFLEEFHVDGLRVDAVASMLYLDYSREEGQWVPNEHGGRENLEAIRFLRRLNSVISERMPGCYTIAEESTAWAGVTAPVAFGGLGFTFKWNMGWMHDTLAYFSRDPVHRRFHQNELTFASIYEHTECFVMPLSHDEVVHGKGSLLAKMPGDRWRKYANLRALLTYQYTRPGKKLVFMGTEFAQEHEWYYGASLPWPASDDVERQAFMRFFADLGRTYCNLPALYASDTEDGGFRWIDASDHDQSVLSYVRLHGDQHVLVVLNLTPVPHSAYRVGSPWPGSYTAAFDSDASQYGGSEFCATTQARTEGIPMHGCDFSVLLDLPPLGVLILVHEETAEHAQARKLGIEDAYFSIDGVRHVTTDATRAALVQAMQGGETNAVDSTMVHEPHLGERAYAMSASVEESPALGIWTQLYALHSEASWGIGDYADLGRLIAWAAQAKLDFVGLNPLHATRLDAQPAIPYHPSSRLFDSPLYIAVTEVPEYAAWVSEHGEPAWLGERLADARKGGSVNYPLVWRLKRDALRLAFRQHCTLKSDHPRRLAFAQMVRRGGATLQRFATFCAIEDANAGAEAAVIKLNLRQDDRPGPESPEVQRFAEEHDQDVQFFAFLQFLCDEQLAECARRAASASMRVGLYLDLAVGVAHDGFDPWNFPELYLNDISLGAPPDALAPQGQDWGLSPLSPQALVADNYRHVRAVVEHSMRHAGALRIDHAMWMQRQFWIPRTREAPGAYVRFPLHALLDVLGQQSARASCVIIGEDLGTVPEGFREALAERGILRYEVLPFTRNGEGRFPSPSDFAHRALLCLSTHDLPTFAEYWSGDDLLLRRQMGVIDEATLLEQVAARMAEKEGLLAWLAQHGTLPDPESSAELVLDSVHALLAQSSSVLVALSLDDLCGEPRSVNVPGTGPDDGFVSFARRMTRSLQSLEADVGLLARMAHLRDLRSTLRGA